MNLAVAQEIYMQPTVLEASVSIPVERDRVYTVIAYSPAAMHGEVKYQRDAGALHTTPLDNLIPALAALATDKPGTLTIRLTRDSGAAAAPAFVLVAKEVSL